MLSPVPTSAAIPLMEKRHDKDSTLPVTHHITHPHHGQRNVARSNLSRSRTAAVLCSR